MATRSFDKFCEGYSKEDLGEFLKANGASEDSAAAFVANCVDGKTFLMLTDDDLKQLVSLIGDRALIRTLLNICKASCKVRTATCYFS